MNIAVIKRSILAISLAAMLPVAAMAETAEEKGLAIAKEAKSRNVGWGNSEATMEMILINKAGNETVRKVRSRSLEVKGDGDKGLSIFDEPKDVRGTAFLSFSHIEGNDDQWLFLPAIKRVKRISSSNKSGPWMASEFAYEDLSSFEVEKYDYKFIREDEIDGDKVFVIELYPKYNNSGYSKTISWLDQDHYRVRKIEYFDKKEDRLKVMTLSQYKQYLGKYWRAHHQEMENVQTGKKTIVKWDEFKFDVGLNEDDFTQSSLKRAK